MQRNGGICLRKLFSQRPRKPRYINGGKGIIKKKGLRQSGSMLKTLDKLMSMNNLEI